MTTGLWTHPAFAGHVTPPGHPEQVARIAYVERALADARFSTLARAEAPAADDVALRRCHPQAYIDRIVAAEPATGWRQLDADTHMSPGSVAAARHAVGGAIAAVDAVVGGEVGNAFVAARPPGHHAERETPMGFCLFGTVAIAAKHALDHHGLARVAVVDFDVHHGNGTQDLLWDEPRAVFFSSHQSPLWPGTGAEHERGAHDTIFNIPLEPDSGGATMRAAYEGRVFPILRALKPDLILVSAGFDAHRADPLAQLRWETADFAWLTARLCDLADEMCQGRLVSVLEGGYDLDALAASVAAHVEVLMEHSA
ncbi:MAG: histone deacetylase family protein [Paracoccaceae bacterium]|uniref:histone deacetylase family protein n=1 Tax=unclassified Seohaeicola TaxID=2641111 RepID=UPI00237BE15E|nr:MULTISPECIES: histone deacetylase family protein [unclassified Seohaeicola]MDD9708799.1 histone deacetylase family protein [Seohaeicola sp. 4SK31]MDD9734910.1 histone deacetylase family protein [Seohaeicola sp. SP36]MDM7968017.1 histone deacetylase family protein [Paracoccaceae bacterium]